MNKETAKVAPIQTVKEQKVVKPVETPKEVKAEELAPEAPKKRVRQRIRISAAPVREKVEFFKKK